MNRSISKLFLAAALAATVVSCGKDGADGIDEPVKNVIDPDDVASGLYSLTLSAGRAQNEIEIVNGDNDPDTRARYDFTNYYWSAGVENIVMSVTEAGTMNVLQNCGLISMSTPNNAAEILHTNFKGTLSLAQYNVLTAQAQAGSLDYYAYYANGKTVTDTNFPASLQFTLPASYTLTPNTFEPAKTPMVAVTKGEDAGIIQPTDMTGLADENGGIHMGFEHTTSYLALEMDVRMMNDNVNSITMTVTGGTADQNRINGTYTYYTDGTTAPSLTGGSGSNSVTINITGGLAVSDVSNKYIIYIPMPAKTFTGQTFTFSFDTGANMTRYGYDDLVKENVTMEFKPGNIHTIRVAPPAYFTYYTGSYESVRIAKTGLYFIEAYGGNGGHISEGGSGKSFRIAGLYELTEGEWITMYIGGAGQNSTGWGNITAAKGGSNGSAYGAGGDAARGGSGSSSGAEQYGEGGGGGGAATFVFRTDDQPTGTNPTFDLSTDVVIVSGGGGGSGGGSSGTYGQKPPAAGGGGVEVDDADPSDSGYGTTGTSWVDGTNEGNANGRGGYGGAGNTPNSGAGGAGGSSNSSGGTASAGSPSSGTTGAGGAGGTGANSGYTFPGWYSGGGGGGGGGGGYARGGGGGGGGSRRYTSGLGLPLGTIPGAGGGGGGGQSFRQGNIPSSDSRYPAVPPYHERTDYSVGTDYKPINGFVYITFIRE